MTKPELMKAVEELRAVRDQLWNKSRSPEPHEREAYDLAYRVDGVIIGLCAEGAALVDTTQDLLIPAVRDAIRDLQSGASLTPPMAEPLRACQRAIFRLTEGLAARSKQQSHHAELVTEARLAGRLGAFETVAALLRKLLPPALFVDVLACLDPLPDFLQCLRQREMTQQAQPAPDSCQNGVQDVPDEGHGDKARILIDPRTMKAAYADVMGSTHKHVGTTLTNRDAARTVLATILEQELLPVMVGSAPWQPVRAIVHAIIDACRYTRQPDSVATGVYDQARNRVIDLLTPLN